VAENSFPAVTLARILRPWGRRGEVAAEIFSDFPKRLASLRQAWLFDGRNPPRPVAIQSCRIHLGQAVFHFAGTDSIDDAERLRGLEVQIPLTERVRLSSNRHYITDLIGCEVWEANATEPLGAVRDVQGAGASNASDAPQPSSTQSRSAESWILAVDTPRGEVLIPMAKEICTRIDTAARRIDVQLPEGLRELNERAVAQPNQQPNLGRSERGERRRDKRRQKRRDRERAEDARAALGPKPPELV
jgi:16S rRNA processing protein RimM